jgi:Domain of unknown function (DUF3883)
MLAMPNLSKYTVYTTIAPERIEDASHGEDPSDRLTEKNRWVAAKALLDEALADGEELPIVFSDSRRCSKLVYWAVLREIEVGSEKITSFRFARLASIRDHSTQELVLRSSREHIAPDFIRPYALCETPDFLEDRIERDQRSHVVEALGGRPASEDAEQDAVIEAVQTAKTRALGGQGFSVSPEARKVIESRAMLLAADHFEAQGFRVEVRGKPYDLLCMNKENSADVLYVEVKGTTTAGKDILLTPNEVRFAREHLGQMVLFVAYGMTVTDDAGVPTAAGGNITILRPWSIDDTALTPLGYSYELPK